MNGTNKWHKPTGPAFNVGEQWKSAGGKIRCKIVSVQKYGDGKWDYDVTYEYEDGARSKKDVRNFQVRYYHIADENLKISTN